MEKLRKVLVVVFSVLCIFFAWEAYLQKSNKSAFDKLAFFAWKTYQKHSGSEMKLLETNEWGPALQEFSRKTDRLVFVKIKSNKNALDYTPSAKAEKILARHYICAELDRDYFPADYGVLRRIAKNDVNFAILSSKGYPLLVASSFDENPEAANGDARILAGVAWVYKKRKEEAKSGLQIALLKANADRRLPELAGLFTERKNTSELFNVRALFEMNDWGNSSAVFSENARLAVRIASGGNRMAKDTSQLAAAKLLAHLEDPAISFGERLLLVRALSEFAMLSDSDSARLAFLNASLEIAKTQRPDGLFSAQNGLVSLRENALALSVMSRAYKVFQDKKFKDAMESSAIALREKSSGRSLLPAVIADSKSGNPKSEAAALDYVLLSRGFLDAYFAGGQPQNLKLSQKVLSRLDEAFADTMNDGWYENSKKSVFAPFHYKVLSDGEQPSTVGEALQILADVNNLNEDISQRFIKILSSLRVTAAPETFLDRASIKLSVLANPMRGSPSKKTLPLAHTDSF